MTKKEFLAEMHKYLATCRCGLPNGARLLNCWSINHYGNDSEYELLILNFYTALRREISDFALEICNKNNLKVEHINTMPGIGIVSIDVRVKRERGEASEQ